MKSHFTIHIDMKASTQANIEFLNKCDKQIKNLRKKIIEQEKQRQITNQLTIEDAIERNSAK